MRCTECGGASTALGVVHQYGWLRRLPGAFSILVFLRISPPTSFLRGSWRVLLSKAHPFLQVRVGGAKQLRVGVHQLLDHLLGVVLLLLDLLGELLHPAKPFPCTFRCLHSPVCG